MSRDITLLHPELQEIIKSFLTDCQKAGLPVLITETFRTAAEQDTLYAQGRTKPGGIVTNCKGADYASLHQWGAAFDFCRNVKGQEFNDSDGFFKKAAAIAKQKGLDWGGDWSGLVDKPHLQMKKFSPDGTAKWLKQKYANPQAFMKTWNGASGTGAATSASAAGPVTSTRPILKRGDKGTPVAELQAQLNKLGYGSLICDGIFGLLTENAVKMFQAKKGFPADGVVGDKVNSALWG